MIPEAIMAVIGDALNVLSNTWEIIKACPRVYNAFLMIGILWIASEVKKKTIYVLSVIFAVYYISNWFGFDVRIIAELIANYVMARIQA